MKIEFNLYGIDGLHVITSEFNHEPIENSFETFNMRDYKNNGLKTSFMQENQVYSSYGVLRGMHVNLNHPQTKLIHVIRGKIFDVVVDLRRESKTFKKWVSIELSNDNHKQLYIPERMGHGYLVVSSQAEIVYKVTEQYIPGDEIGFAWNSPIIGINWPPLQVDYILSESDSKNPILLNIFNDSEYSCEVEQ